MGQSKLDETKTVEKEYYRMPAEEDMYIPPGRKWHDRDDLCPKEEQIELGPPVLQNEQIHR